MGRRTMNAEIEKRPWICMWPNIGIGKYFKRQLHKARRRHAEEVIKAQLEEIEREHLRGRPGWERESNWKTW
jgi:hypothetical protein